MSKFTDWWSEYYEENKATIVESLIAGAGVGAITFAYYAIQLRKVQVVHVSVDPPEDFEGPLPDYLDTVLYYKNGKHRHLRLKQNPQPLQQAQ